MNNLILKEGEETAKRSIKNLVFLSFIKAIAGFVTGMPVILADAISTLTDTLGLFAAFIGLKLSRKTADKDFSYGYYKFETLAALVISLSIIYLGVVIFLGGLNSLTHVEAGGYRPLAISTTIISIILSYKLANELRVAAEKVNSLSLLASSKDKKMDIFSGIIVLISIFANYKNIPYVEGIVTIIISLLIIKEGIFSSKESLFFLLDYWNDPILVHKIKRIFKHQHEVVKKINRIRLRRAGTFIFGEAFVEVNPFIGMEDLRDSLNILEKKVLEINPYIKDFSIHTHIPKAKKAIIAIPVKSGKSLSAEIANTLKETRGYIFVNVSKNKITKFYYKKLTEEDKNFLNFGAYLKREKTNILIDNKINSITYYNLRKTNNILIYPNFIDVKKVKQTISLLLIDI